MLYDPRWEDPLSTTRIIGWLESMPVARDYNYQDCSGGCLWDQYLRSIGHDRWKCKAEEWQRFADLFDALHQVPYVSIARQEPWTYGAALARARAKLPQ